MGQTESMCSLGGLNNAYSDLNAMNAKPNLCTASSHKDPNVPL